MHANGVSMLKKHSIIISTALVLASCAGPESYQQKMARYTPNNVLPNQVPEISSSEFKFTMPSKKQSATRMPASAPAAPNASIELKDSNPTNKKLYFLSLYSEYEELKIYSTEFNGPNINICPNFHTSLLRHNEKTTSKDFSRINNKFSYDKMKLSSDLYVASFPELLLPVSKVEKTPRVIDIIRNKNSTTMSDIAINELVHTALDIHLEKTYSEINQLCESGASDNYYIYENLITYIKNNKFEAGNTNMNLLLKTTVFSNLALMTSLEKHVQHEKPGRSLASVGSKTLPTKHIYLSEMMTRLNVSWANQYYNYIKTSY